MGGPPRALVQWAAAAAAAAGAALTLLPGRRGARGQELSGTYYAYSCAAGAQQVAFNWGTQYTYAPVESLQAIRPPA